MQIEINFLQIIILTKFYHGPHFSSVLGEIWTAELCWMIYKDNVHWINKYILEQPGDSEASEEGKMYRVLLGLSY